MSLSRKMRRAASMKNWKAANKQSFNQRINNEPQLGQDDAFLSNILSQISSKPFLKKVLLNAIGLTLMAATPSFAGTISKVGDLTDITTQTIGGKNVYEITGGKIVQDNTR